MGGLLTSMIVSFPFTPLLKMNSIAPPLSNKLTFSFFRFRQFDYALPRTEC
jgi:hypothetical protein